MAKFFIDASHATEKGAMVKQDGTALALAGTARILYDDTAQKRTLMVAIDRMIEKASETFTQGAAAVPAPVQVIAGSSFAQWVKAQFATNTVDRSTAGDYSRISGAGQGGQKYVANMNAGTGEITQTVTLATRGADDHDDSCRVQLWSGRWFESWNEHSIAGKSGFNYHISDAPHSMVFSAVRNIPGVKSGTDGITNSTYSQVQTVNALKRVNEEYRAGGSGLGAWMLRYCDNIGAAIADHAWSEERILHDFAYMETADISDTVTRAVCYNHPTNAGSHSIYEFEWNKVTGVISASGAPVVIGGVTQNVYSYGAGQVSIPSSSMRLAVDVPTNTSRLYSFDGTNICYQTMTYSSAGGGTWGDGTYFLGVRGGDTGPYVTASLGGTGRPVMGGARGYYASFALLGPTLAARSVNKGASIGVGSYAIELMDLVGGVWTPRAEPLVVSANILMRLNVFEGDLYYMEATVYTDYDDFQASTKRIRLPGIVWTKAPSVPASADPTATAVALSGSPSAGTEGQPYSWTPTRTGGVGPFTYALTAGSLSGSGLSLNTSTGEVSGATPVLGNYTGLGITVTDTANGNTFALNSLSIAIAANTGFVPAPAATLTKLTDLGGNLYRANSDAASQGGILFTNLKTVPGAATWAVRQGFNHADASGSIGLGSSASATALLATWERTVQSTAAGLLQIIATAGGTATSTGFTFPDRRPGNIIELYGSADNIVRLRVSTDGGSNWTELGAIGAAIATPLYVRFSASFSTIGRVIDTPMVKGLTA